MNARLVIFAMCFVALLFVGGCSSGSDPVNADKDMPKKAKDKDK